MIILKDDNSKRYQSNYQLAKQFPLVIKFTSRDILTGGLVNDENTQMLQKLLPELGEAELPEVSWKYNNRLNIPVLPLDETMIVFINQSQTDLGACVQVTNKENITGSNKFYSWGSEEYIVLGNKDLVIPDLCIGLKVNSTKISDFDIELQKQIDKQKLLLQNQTLLKRYVGIFSSKYKVTLEKKTLSQLQSINFEKAQLNMIEALKSKSENTKRVKMIQLYALEQVVNQVIQSKQTVNE